MSAEARADLLLGSPSGQLLLAGCLGREFGHTLTGLRWQKAAPEEIRAATRAVVADGEWLGLLDFDEFGLLAAVARAHPGFGGGIAADAGTLALLALARDELRPVGWRWSWAATRSAGPDPRPRARRPPAWRRCRGIARNQASCHSSRHWRGSAQAFPAKQACTVGHRRYRTSGNPAVPWSARAPPLPEE